MRFSRAAASRRREITFCSSKITLCWRDITFFQSEITFGCFRFGNRPSFKERLQDSNLVCQTVGGGFSRRTESWLDKRAIGDWACRPAGSSRWNATYLLCVC
jgi:hypothetical protein